MGEIADAMLDGTMCSCCGEYLGGDEGYPVQCAGCRRAERSEPRVPRFDRYAIKSAKIQQPGDGIRHGDRMACPFCVKRVKVSGFGDHMLDQHRDKWPSEKELSK
jgi:hypothetical protein